MKTRLSQLTLILAVITGSGLSVAVAAEQSQAVLKAQAKITQEEATTTALAQVLGGTIKSVEIENENNKLVWSFDISKPGFTSITEIQVDANTGKIVSTLVETPIDQAKEAAADPKPKQ